jgi:hypothetical protein
MAEGGGGGRRGEERVEEKERVRVSTRFVGKSGKYQYCTGTSTYLVLTVLTVVVGEEYISG